MERIEDNAPAEPRSFCKRGLKAVQILLLSLSVAVILSAGCLPLCGGKHGLLIAPELCILNLSVLDSDALSWFQCAKSRGKALVGLAWTSWLRPGRHGHISVERW